MKLKKKAKRLIIVLLIIIVILLGILFLSDKIFNKNKTQEVKIVNEIDKKLITSSLYTRDIPDPDLVIRTSGECRLSNFLLWQSAYSELYFTPTLWPDFDKDALIKAVEAYQSRDRRYGLVKDKNNK